MKENPVSAPPDVDPNAEPAHVLWVELASRIATRGLHYRSGDEETAAKSIYMLFPKTRELMEKFPLARDFHKYGLRLLNEALRPCTARWHGWMIEASRFDGEGQPILEFRDETVRRKFRQELRDLRAEVDPYQRIFHAMSLGEAIDPAWLPPRPEKAPDPLGGPLESVLRPQVALRAAGENGRDKRPIAREIERAEHDDVRERRKIFAAATVDKEGLNDAIGLALSGGGIRSATFCLGVIQALQRRRLFEKIDYLSTVSGGGYLGGFLSCYLGSEVGKAPENPTASASDRLDDAFKPADEGTAEAAALRHLRNNSRYLLGGGLPALLQVAGVLVSGFLTSMLMLLTLPLLAAWLVLAADKWELPMMGIFQLTGLALVILWVVRPLFERLSLGEEWDSKLAKRARFVDSLVLALAIVVAACGLLAVAPALVGMYRDSGIWIATEFEKAMGWKAPDFLIAALGVLAPAVFGALSKRRDGTVRVWAKLLFHVTAPAFFLAAFLIFASHLGVGGAASPNLWLAALPSAALLVWAFAFVDINLFSLHNYYRDRLCECYLARREGKSIVALHRLKLSALGANPAAPVHLINANLNAAASPAPGLRGRNGDFFLFSRRHCGSPLTGYVTTQELEEADPHVDLGTAMAISGAAASANMGWQSKRRLRFILTLLNVRLGYWLPRPGRKGKITKLDSPGPVQLVREMLGAVHEKSRFVHISDGGHIENLATYELLRRQCKFIVCVDAGMEPGMECADLMRLQRYALIDFGIAMQFDPTDLTLLPTHNSRAYAVLVKIDYAPEDRGDRETSEKIGWMLYIKLAVTGTEPRYVLDYRRQNPAFPHQTTADQFYDEAQFEAYRTLGDCAAESLLRREITDGTDPKDVRRWFGMLASSLLADNDEVFGKR